MPAFDPSTSILAGMSPADVRAVLNAAQQCVIQIQTGAKIASASYTQGDGAKSISYRATQLAEAISFVRLCQAQLGLIGTPRTPIRVMF